MSNDLIVRKYGLTDEQIKEICVEWRKGMIGRKKSYLRCAEVSYSLQGYLSYLGQQTTICTGKAPSWCDVANHVWLELQDGRVIDLTADQFNRGKKKYSKIYIGEPIPEIHEGATKRRERRKAAQ